jgi:hypothetical protein
MLDKLQVHQVVAFHESGSPIDVPAERWAATFHRKSAILRLRHRGYCLNYDLCHDLICLIQTDEKQVTALGRTVGRMALTGISTRLFFGGKGMAGAMLDLSARGAEKNTIVSGILIFNDTTTVSFVASANNYARFRAMLPKECIQPSSAERAEKLFDVVHRMTVDGERVLGEVDDEISGLAIELRHAEALADSGDNFAVRDSARHKVQELRRGYVQLVQMKRAVAFQLNRPLMLEKAKSPEKVESPAELPAVEVAASPASSSGWQKMPLILFLVASLLMTIICGAAGFVVAAIVGTATGASGNMALGLVLVGFVLGCIIGLRYVCHKRQAQVA